VTRRLELIFMQNNRREIKAPQEAKDEKETPGADFCSSFR
jgi:hypothetical protein